MTGELVAAEQRLTELSSRAANVIELANVTCLRADLYVTLNQSSERAVAVCLDYLRYLGVEWSPHPSEEEARDEAIVTRRSNGLFVEVHRVSIAPLQAGHPCDHQRGAILELSRQFSAHTSSSEGATAALDITIDT